MKNILRKIATLLCAAVLLGSCSEETVSAGREALMAVVRQAEALVAEAVEGIDEGNIAPGSKAALQARIDQAYFIMENTESEEAYENAAGLLKNAIEAFNANIVKAGVPYFNEGSKMNLGPVGDWDMGEEFTIECRVRFDEFASGDQNVISCEGGSGGFMLRNNGASLQFYIGDGGWQGVSFSPMKLDTWYHVAVMYKAGSHIEMFVDGASVGRANCASLKYTPSINLQAGTAPSYASRYMRGNIQHLAIWSDVRTASEVVGDMQGISASAEGLKAYWPLTLNRGTEIADETGAHTASFLNVAWNDPE